MSKIIDAEDILADARDWMARFFQGRSREEIERIKDTLRVAFPPPAPGGRPVKTGFFDNPVITPAAPGATRPKRGSK